MQYSVLTVSNNRGNSGPTISIKCPHCGHYGTFHSIASSVYLENCNLWFGQRFCPNTKCKGHIFYIAQSGGEVIQTFPNETIPFDKSNIPDKIINTFEEALVCHSNSCFVASGIMIRKTLEVICDDNEVKGDNLFKRLKELGNKILVPKELIEAMDELRLLGNDAAHIDAKTFEQVGRTEIDISIEFTKEILKAIYQYEDLLTKLRSLKKPTQ